MMHAESPLPSSDMSPSILLTLGHSELAARTVRCALNLVPSPATSATSVYLPSVLSSQRSRTNSFSLMRVLIVLERSYFFIASGARLTLHCLSDLRSDRVQ